LQSAVVTARRAALTSPGHAVGPGATLRCCRIVTVPVRLARPGHPVLHLPAHRPWAAHWTRLWQAVFDLVPASAGIRLIPSNRLPRADPEPDTWKRVTDQQLGPGDAGPREGHRGGNFGYPCAACRS